MTPSLALVATVTGTLITLAPIDPAAVRASLRTLDPDAPFEQTAEVTADLRLIDHITTWLPAWQQHGLAALDHKLRLRDQSENRLLAAHGYPIPTEQQQYRARQAIAAATAAIQTAADQAHPPTECPACHGWEDCPDADRAYRNALHTAWVNRWTTSA